MKKCIGILLTGFIAISSSYASEAIQVTYKEKIEGIKTYPAGYPCSPPGALDGMSAVSAGDEARLKSAEVMLIEPRVVKDGASARITGNYMGDDSSAAAVCKILGYSSGRTFKNEYCKNSTPVLEAVFDGNGALTWFDKNNIMFAEIILCSSKQSDRNL